MSNTATTWTWESRRGLDFEREERVGVHLVRERGATHVDLAVERWWVRDGIGWRPDSETGTAVVSGDLSSDAWLARARIHRASRFRLRGADWRLRLLAQGHAVLGEVEIDGDRGVGWPPWQAYGRLGLDREFFSPRNRIGIDLDAHAWGAHRDDGLGPVGDLEVPSDLTLSTRAWLRVRDAEMSVNFDHVLGGEAVEVLGTQRRSSQRRWQLVWSFFN